LSSYLRMSRDETVILFLRRWFIRQTAYGLHQEINYRLIERKFKYSYIDVWWCDSWCSLFLTHTEHAMLYKLSGTLSVNPWLKRTTTTTFRSPRLRIILPEREQSGYPTYCWLGIRQRRESNFMLKCSPLLVEPRELRGEIRGRRRVSESIYIA
jgi:hypothetical protein